MKKHGFFLLMIMMASNSVFSQCKTYSFNAQHEKINCTDVTNLKQGFWDTTIRDNHGEPGYKTNGFYKDNKKEGRWITMSLVGDTLADENYKYGYKDGLQFYYNIIGILREESWRATNPENPYDTVRVYDLNNPDKYDLKVVKVDASTVKHGTWTYYDPERQAVTRTEEYVVDKLVSNKKRSLDYLNDSMNVAKKNSVDSLSASKQKPPEVIQYEKKNAKKRIKVRDGATGVD